MKKRMLSAFLCLCMMLTMVPAAFAANGTDTTSSSTAPSTTTTDGTDSNAVVAKIGDQAYTSLKAAVDAALGENSPGTTINMVANAKVTEKITINKDVTLNAGVYKISGDTAAVEVNFEIAGGTFTVNGGTFTGFGDTAGTVTGAAVFKIPDTANGAKIVADGTEVVKFNRAAFDVRNGAFELTDCVINCDNSQSSRLTKGIVAGYDSTGNVTGKVTDCKFSGSNSTYEGWSASGIEVSAGATVEVTGTTIESMKGGISVARNYGHDAAIVTVNDCIINGQDYALRIFESNNSLDAVNGTSAKLTVNGGTYTGDVRVSIGDSKTADGKSVIAIQGGSFSGITTDGFEKFVPEAYLASKTGEDAYQVVAASDAAASIDSDNYATLEAAVAAANEGQTVNLLKDVTLSSKLTISKAITLDGGNYTITGQAGDANVYIEITGGDVTVQNLKVKDFGGNTTTVGQWGLFKVPDGEGTTAGKLTLKNVTASNFNRAAVDVRTGTFEIDSCTFDCANQSESKLTKGVLAQNVTGTINNTTITNAETTYTEEGNAWNTNAVETWGDTSLTITGCTFGKSGAEVKNGISMNTGTGASTVTMSDTTILATDRIVKLTPDNNGTGTSELTINSGYYTGTFKINQGNVEGTGCTIMVNGGYFTDDPTPYLAEDKIAVTSTEPGYAYTVDEKSANAAEVEVAAPEISSAAPAYEEGSAEKELVDEVGTALTNTAPELETAVLTAAAGDVANENNVTIDEATKELTNAGIPVEDGDTVTVVIQPYMNVTIKEVSVEGDAKTFTLDITPMYKTVATTANLAAGGEIVLDDEDGKTVNSVEIGNAQQLEIDKPIEVTIPLPAGFEAADNKLYVIHEKDNGRIYVYTGEVKDASASDGAEETTSTGAAKVLVFTNPNGFSDFTVSTNNPAVAKIGEVGYISLQDAVNAVENNGKITVLKDGLSATVSGSSKTFTLENDGSSEIKVTLNGQTLTIAANDSQSFTYTKPSGGSSGGGGGGGASTSYAVSVSSSIDNGSVTVSPKNAAKGTTVTITVTPDAGYELDTLTVKDASGNAIDLTRESDTTYTFEMPSGRVTVDATFAEISTTPSNPFADVASNAYYADAVLWAVENDITEGTSATTFSPNASCTRAQMVTVLGRAAGSPEPQSAENPFTDVAANAYYADAVLWAVEKGITTGTRDTPFSPNATVTRGQTVTFLYRDAGSPAASAAGTFTDVAADAYYAAAVQWAVSEGVTDGMTSTTFQPDGNCTRAQIVTFLYRYLAA